MFSGGSSGGSGASGGSGGASGSGSGGVAGMSGAAGAGTGGSAGAPGGSGGGAGSGGAGGAAGSDGGVTGCDLNGYWASYSTIKVSWPQTAVIKGGTGQLQIWLLHQRTQSGSDVNDVVHLCGIQIPGFETALLIGNEKYGVRFLADTFNAFPTIPAQATLDQANGQFQSAPFAILFGAQLANPLVDAWPSLQSIKTDDTDADGHAGVTVQADKSSGYADPPLDLLRTSRATDLFIASRTVSKLTGTLSTCDAMSGTVEVVPVGGGSGVGSHIVGCIQENGSECNSQQTNFADSNAPVFQPASGSTFVSDRVDAQTTCANVRHNYPKP